MTMPERSTDDIRRAVDDLRAEMERLLAAVSADAPPEELAAAKELALRGIAKFYEAADIIGEHKGEQPRVSVIEGARAASGEDGT
jgi:transcriptional regulator of nitric oxide reductase